MGKITKRIHEIILGKAKDPSERGIFHSLSLIAFFAWVGLGSDGLSSSCYGPEAAFLALRGHEYLSVFVALATALTVFLISASYSQIIELFPHGGGGYVVASKLLSPRLGAFSGSALFIDYVLTIAISVASCVEAVFSFLPVEWQQYRLAFQLAAAGVLIIMNLRGVKESVIPLIPIFLVFVATHLFFIGYSFLAHIANLPEVAASTSAQMRQGVSQLGLAGVLFMIMRSYSLGAGTFTGIEAVSNGVPVLRDPKVATGKRTMRYMAVSLAVTVFGLMVSYLFYHVHPEPGKTLNAVLFHSMAAQWGGPGQFLVVVTLLSEGLLLFVAAQTGFLDGPRVLSSMAVDRWLPTRFSSLSGRLVARNGVLLMGLAALVTLAFTRGSVQYIVVLYSINVFITFSLSQLGMVRHWWLVRREEPRWLRKISLNGTGLLFTVFILVSVVVMKFFEGGWITLLITGATMGIALYVRRHYDRTAKLLARLDNLKLAAQIPAGAHPDMPSFDPSGKTAILLVSGFNGLGLHTLFNVIRLFGGEFRNFAFVQVGVLDAGNFKGAQEVERLKAETRHGLNRYVQFMAWQGYYAEGISCLGVDVISEAQKAVQPLLSRFPRAVVFGGQLVFPEDTFLNRLLHNNTVFDLQRYFYREGVPFVILPIRV